MPPAFLIALDISAPIEWERYSRLKHLKYIYVKVPSDGVESCLERLRNEFVCFDIYFDAASLSSVEDVVALLDAGAASVMVTQSQHHQLSLIDNVNMQRVTLIPEAGQNISRETLDLKSSNGLLLSETQNTSTLEASIKDMVKVVELVFAQLGPTSQKDAVELSRAGAIPIISQDALSFEKEAEVDETKGIPAADLLLAKAVSDRSDGLYTTLVVDERGIALGLVYSSKESVAESLRTGRGVYQSRKRGLWYKGETSGDIQELVNITLDCDQDCLCFTVRQIGKGFCHLGTATCMGEYKGLSKLQKTLSARGASAPPGSYTARLFNDSNLLSAKIREEATELCEATEKDHIAFEAADLLYFALTKCVASGVSLEDVERKLDEKSVKVKRRKGDAKPQFITSQGNINGSQAVSGTKKDQKEINEVTSVQKPKGDSTGVDPSGRICMTRYVTCRVRPQDVQKALKRPSQKSTDKVMSIVKPIIDDVRQNGDKALLSYTHKFEKAVSLTSPVIQAPFSPSLMKLPQETIDAIDVSFENIRKFHAAQKETKPLQVETMPGVVCSRFARAIERVGLYVPGGTAVLPSTALMLGVPAMVAGCKKIVFASPPRADGKITPEIVYVAHKVGAEAIVLAGGAQAVAALAHGTESVSKVDKILGPGNQFVTAGKMLVSNDTSANVSIDMPAGPSEVLVIADKTSDPAFVAADLLSQAEHGVDSQVICIAVGMNEIQLGHIEEELHKQASALPRVDMVRGAIEHSVTLVVNDIMEAMALSNQYAPEHLIIQTQKPEAAAALVENAGSVFIGPWTPESVGDYSAGVNHSLPTYGYARQYSGVSLSSYIKHITSSQLSNEGLKNISGAVMQLARVEELEAHRRAVDVRLRALEGS